MHRLGVRLAFVLLLTHALGLTGCFTIAKQAYHEAVGAQGDVLTISEVREPALARFQSVEFTPATTTVGSKLCPAELLRAYDRGMNLCAARLTGLYSGTDPRLTVDSEILYFQKKGLLGGAFTLTRVRMRAAEQLAFDALVRAESEAFRAG